MLLDGLVDKVNVILVDDDISLLETSRRLLSLSGFKVTSTQDGRVALQWLLAGAECRILVTDLRMPWMSGLELLIEARCYQPSLPVVIYSAFGSQAAAVAAARLGASEFVSGMLLGDDDIVAVVRRNIDKRPFCGTDLALLVGPALARWLPLVEGVIGSDDDVATVKDWAIELAVSETTLKRRCVACGVHASNALDFGRAARIVSRYSKRSVNWYNVLDIAENTTLVVFLSRAGFSQAEAVPTLSTFIEGQCFITDPELLTALSRLLHAI